MSSGVLAGIREVNVGGVLAVWTPRRTLNIPLRSAHHMGVGRLSITFGSPGGGKEIEVLVKSLKKMKEKDTNLNFLSSGRCFPEVQTMFFQIGPKNLKFGTLSCPDSGQISSYRGLSGTIRRRKMRSFF